MSKECARVEDSLITKLLEDLASPDPAVRDGDSLGALCELVDAGALTGEQAATLGSTLRERLDHPRIEVRSFAALVLGPMVLAGSAGQEWFPHFAMWYASEDEITGHDPQRGWLHAVAHGADTLAAFGWTWPESPRPVLDLAARRMLRPCGAVWHDQEDDRLGFAVAVALSNPHLTTHDATGWLDPVEEAILHRGPGPLSAATSNTIRTLRVSALLTHARMDYAGQGIAVRHPKAVEKRLLAVLHAATPWMWTAGH